MQKLVKIQLFLGRRDLPLNVAALDAATHVAPVAGFHEPRLSPELVPVVAAFPGGRGARAGVRCGQHLHEMLARRGGHVQP